MFSTDLIPELLKVIILPFIIFESLLIFDHANISIQIEISFYLKALKVGSTMVFEPE